MYNPYQNYNQTAGYPQQQFINTEYNQFQQMIYDGQFGMNAPQQMNNMQFGNQNNFVFQPINNYPQQTYSYYQPPKYDYYNPYGAPINQYNQYPPYNYYNGYQQQYAGYNGYNNYRPFMQPAQQQQMIQERVDMEKIKYRYVYGYLGKEISEDELDKMLNPTNEVNKPSPEEMTRMQEVNYLCFLESLPEINEQNCSALRQAAAIRNMSMEYHKKYDRHSMFEFLQNDLWKIERDIWLEENTMQNYNRNLSMLYNSKDYNELLRLHKSANPYVDEILNTSRYDNNIDDMEIGVQQAFDRERRRRLILEGKVPEFISSEETQKRRELWTQQILQQIRQKNGGM